MRTQMKSAPINLDEIERLDDFFLKEVKIAKWEELSDVAQIILTISHGQADVERGFPSIRVCFKRT